LDKRSKNAVNKIEKNFNKLDLASSIKTFTNVAGAAMGVISAFQTLKGIGNIWDNDDLTTGEKVT